MVLLAYADAGVEYFELDGVLVGDGFPVLNDDKLGEAQRKLYVTLERELGGIAEKVDQDLLKALAVGLDGGRNSLAN